MKINVDIKIPAYKNGCGKCRFIISKASWNSTCLLFQEKIKCNGWMGTYKKCKSCLEACHKTTNNQKKG